MIKMIKDKFGLDHDYRMIYTNAGRKRLPEYSFRLVRRLAEQPGVVVGNEALIKSIWGDKPPGKIKPGQAPLFLRALVYNTRRRVGDNIIENVNGLGYKLVLG